MFLLGTASTFHCFGFLCTWAEAIIEKVGTYDSHEAQNPARKHKKSRHDSLSKVELVLIRARHNRSFQRPSLEVYNAYDLVSGGENVRLP